MNAGIVAGFEARPKQSAGLLQGVSLPSVPDALTSLQKRILNPNGPSLQLFERNDTLRQHFIQEK